MDQAELDKSMKLLELVENDVGYVVASSYPPDSASTPVKGASNIGPRGLISHIRARIARSIKAKNVNCDVCMSDPIDRPPAGPRYCTGLYGLLNKAALWPMAFGLAAL